MQQLCDNKGSGYRFKIPIWLIPSSEERNIDGCNPDFIDFIRGFIPYNLPIFLRRHLLSNFTTKEIENLILSTRSYALSSFKKWVWNFRNEALKLHQRSLGITKRSLKLKFRNRYRSADATNQATRSYTRDNNTDILINEATQDTINDWYQLR